MAGTAATIQNVEAGGAQDTSYQDHYPAPYFPHAVYTDGASFYTANQPWIKPYAEQAKNIGDDSSGRGSGNVGAQASQYVPSTSQQSYAAMSACSNCDLPIADNTSHESISTGVVYQGANPGVDATPSVSPSGIAPMGAR